MSKVWKFSIMVRCNKCATVSRARSAVGRMKFKQKHAKRCWGAQR